MVKMEKNSKYDVVIIGAGLGGLNSGIYLQSKNPGLRTLIVEQNNYPGGYASGFVNRGFYFDTGAESILGYEQGYANTTLKEVDFKHPFHRVEPIEAFYQDDKIFRMFSDPKKFIAEIEEHHPDQLEGVKKLIDASLKVRSEIDANNLSYEKLTFGKMLKILFKHPMLRKYGFKNFREYLEDFITDEKLFEYFSLYTLWFGLKFEEITAPVGAQIIAMSFTEGLFYPEGGFGAFSKNLAEHFIARGGTIKYNSPVEKIIVKKKTAKGVQLKDGTIIESDYIIANTDLHKTVNDIVGKEHFSRKYLNTVNSLNVSVSGLLLYLGVEDLNLDQYPPHFIIGKTKEIILNTRKGEFDLDGLGIRIPSNADPTLKVGNKDSIVVLAFPPYEWNNHWNIGENNKRTKEYRKLKHEVTEKIIAKIEETIPNLSKHVVLKRLATPYTFERYNSSTKGAWYGPAFNQKLTNFKSPVKNLFLTGSNTGGSGVSQAMNSGINVGKYVLKVLDRKFQRDRRKLANITLDVPDTLALSD
ncbi:MAG: phytoene desaturase family protein [Candidatus Heimdallarchaeota archaeon]